MSTVIAARRLHVRNVPFLKWAGGKRWFASQHLHLAPTCFTRYLEPFLGSGAIYFALEPRQAILSDVNEDLIDCYEAVRSSPVAVAELLNMHHSHHCKHYYYEMRASKPADLVEKAAWFIYLNRTCWNGLYRVNRNNEFNVPIGTKTDVVLSSDDFTSLSLALKQAVLVAQDFEATLDDAQDGDFVFVDPPYTVKHNFNGFTKYNDTIFSWADQIRLRDAIVRASSRGAMVLMTNANHASIRDLYAGVGEHLSLQRSSILSASAQHRTRVEELVIRTWPRN